MHGEGHALSAGVHARAGRSLITNVIIKTPDWKWTGDVNDVMPGSDRLRILGDFWKKALSWDLRLGEESWFFDLGEASLVMDYGMPVRCWVRWNSQHSKNCVCLSRSLRVENLKVKKVIKVSYLNKESRQCFAYFGIPMHVNVSRIRILYMLRIRILSMLQNVFHV